MPHLRRSASHMLHELLVHLQKAPGGTETNDTLQNEQEGGTSDGRLRSGTHFLDRI